MTNEPDEAIDGGDIHATQQRQRFIGREIRRLFDDVVNEKVPGEMLDLLRQLDAKGEGHEHR